MAYLDHRIVPGSRLLDGILVGLEAATASGVTELTELPVTDDKL